MMLWTEIGTWAGLSSPTPGPDDVAAVLALGRELGLDGLAARYLVTKGAAPTSEALERAHSELKRWRRANVVRIAVASEIATDLAAAGVPCVPFKGVALVCREYADPGLRPMDDIDLLVPRRSFRSALAMLEKKGWRRSSPPSHLGSGSYQARLEGPAGTVAELHHAFEAPELFPIDYDSILDRAEPCDGEPLGFRLMTPEDTLLGLALHEAKHGWILQARDVLDLALVVREVRDWAAVWTRARRWHLTGALVPALHLGRRLGAVATARSRWPNAIVDALLSDAPPFSRLGRFPWTAHAFAMLLTAGPSRFLRFSSRFGLLRLGVLARLHPSWPARYDS